jgi:hypothetical protein
MAGAGFHSFAKLRRQMCNADLFKPRCELCGLPQEKWLKPFRIWLRISRNNQHYLSFSSVNDSAETASAVSMTPLKL